MYTKTTEDFVRALVNACGVARRKMAEWTASVAADPMYAMQWADSMYAHAATLGCNKQVLQMLGFLDSGVPIENAKVATMAQVQACLIREMTDMARANNSSTSQSSNMLDRAKLAQIAKLVEIIPVYMG